MCLLFLIWLALNLQREKIEAADAKKGDKDEPF